MEKAGEGMDRDFNTHHLFFSNKSTEVVEGRVNKTVSLFQVFVCLQLCAIGASH